MCNGFWLTLADISFHLRAWCPGKAVESSSTLLTVGSHCVVLAETACKHLLFVGRKEKFVHIETPYNCILKKPTVTGIYLHRCRICHYLRFVISIAELVIQTLYMVCAKICNYSYIPFLRSLFLQELKHTNWHDHYTCSFLPRSTLPQHSIPACCLWIGQGTG